MNSRQFNLGRMSVQVIEIPLAGDSGMASLLGGLFGGALLNIMADKIGLKPLTIDGLVINEINQAKDDVTIRVERFIDNPEGFILIARDPRSMPMDLMSLQGKPMQDINKALQTWLDATTKQYACCGPCANEAIAQSDTIPCVFAMLTVVKNQGDIHMIHANGGMHMVNVPATVESYVDIQSLIGNGAATNSELLDTARELYLVDELARKQNEAAAAAAAEKAAQKVKAEVSEESQPQHTSESVPVHTEEPAEPVLT